jgi:hypothetical protein
LVSAGAASVTYDASRDARNAMQAATSSGVPIRPIGIVPRAASRAVAGSDDVIAVSMNPGATLLTVMLRVATSRASDFVSPIKPAFAAE